MSLSVRPERSITTLDQPSFANSLRVALLVLSEAAAAIHFAVLGDHFDEYLAFGFFFAAVASFQLLWPVFIVSSASPLPVWAGAQANLLIVAVWTASRTTGLPLGPGSGIAEPVELIDAAATAYEIAIIIGCLWLLGFLRQPRAVPPAVQTIGFVLLMMAVASLTTISLILSSGGEVHEQRLHPHGPSQTAPNTRSAIESAAEVPTIGGQVGNKIEDTP